VKNCAAVSCENGAQLGFRPALLDHLYRVTGELCDPRIIEAEYLRNITRSSVTDGLTGLYHQTYFKEHLRKVLDNHRRRADFVFAVVLLDLDHFKQYNDQCGHLRGDEALRRTAEIIRGCLREGDIAARYGGEEFVLLIPGIERRAAYRIAERIRQAIEKEPFPAPQNLGRYSLTISGGIAVYPDNGETVDDLIEAADRELYLAKTRRNVISPPFRDRRRGVRRPVRTLVQYASFDGMLYRPGLSCDVSEYGMSMKCDNNISEGMTLALRLTRPFWGENLDVTAAVRQVRVEGELVVVGLEFGEALASIERLLPLEGMPLDRSVSASTP
jgi:diguanylate cyclase (GGDEF)-like protein